MSYSVDFRKRVLEVREKEDLTIEETAKRFVVSERSINRWLKRGEELAANKPGPTTAYKIDRAALKELVEKEPDCYLDEYAEKLGSKRSTVWYNLKVLKITRKKNHPVRRTK